MRFCCRLVFHTRRYVIVTRWTLSLCRIRSNVDRHTLSCWYEKMRSVLNSKVVSRTFSILVYHSFPWICWTLCLDTCVQSIVAAWRDWKHEHGKAVDKAHAICRRDVLLFSIKVKRIRYDYATNYVYEQQFLHNRNTVAFIDLVFIFWEYNVLSVFGKAVSTVRFNRYIEILAALQRWRASHLIVLNSTNTIMK